jgi:hypothetical protein
MSKVLALYAPGARHGIAARGFAASSPGLFRPPFRRGLAAQRSSRLQKLGLWPTATLRPHEVRSFGGVMRRNAVTQTRSLRRVINRC